MKLIVAENEIVCRAAASWMKARYRRNGCFVGNGYTVAWPQIFQDSVELQKAEYSEVLIAIEHHNWPAFGLFRVNDAHRVGTFSERDMLSKWLEEGRQMIKSLESNKPIQSNDRSIRSYLCFCISNVIHKQRGGTEGIIIGVPGREQKIIASGSQMNDL